MTYSLQILGSGTCRLSPSRAQCSAALKLGHYALIFDVGAGVPARIAEAELLMGCTELHIHISHRHEDHVLGLFSLLQGLTWSDAAEQIGVEKVVVHCTHEVHSLIAAVRSAFGETMTDLQGMRLQCTPRSLEFQVGPDHEDWVYSVGEITVRSVHLPEHNNHGIRFTIGSETYAFTGDATKGDERLAEFLRDADAAVFDMGHLVNVYKEGRFQIDLAPAIFVAAASQAKLLIPTHIYLRHLQHQRLAPGEWERHTARLVADFAAGARAAGFQGQIVCGEDLLLLYPRQHSTAAAEALI